jgi:hypothetical protein
MARVWVEVTGLKEFRAQLKAMDAGLPKMIRVALNEASDLVISYARPKVPHRSGRAQSSLKVRSSQKEARIAAGGTRAPYYPWLDFGGTTPRGGTRPFYTEGRYIYPGLRANRDEITEKMSTALTALAHDAGLEVT